MLKNTHLFESIPTSFIKGAFLDRIHLYNPGWEIRMLKKESFSKGYGLITDYIAAVLHELRNKDLTSLLKDYAKFDPSLSERDHLAIRKTFSGMVKLLYPDGNMTNEEAFELVDFAAESRKRVKDQLYIIDETFKAEPAYFEYTDMKSGRQVYIQTMEQIENNIPLVKKNETDRIPSEPARPTNTVSISHVSETPQTEVTSAGSELQTCVKEIRENQKGISFKKLFADYLKGSRKITITDPFIRLYYQVDNLLEFLNVVKEVTADQSDVKIHLSTQNDEEKIPEMIDIFDEITDDLAASGIEFTYDFDATHDRSIKLDTGWMITLGRGLDIYDKYPKFSTSKFNQEERRCKKCTITYNKEVGDFE
jgi:ATP-dependent Lon protease